MVTNSRLLRELMNEMHFLRMIFMTAIDDLNASIDALATAVTVEVAALVAAIGKEGVDNSGDIEAAVARVNAATKALSDSVAPAPAPAPVDTPAAPVDAPSA